MNTPCFYMVQVRLCGSWTTKRVVPDRETADGLARRCGQVVALSDVRIRRSDGRTFKVRVKFRKIKWTRAVSR